MAASSAWALTRPTTGTSIAHGARPCWLLAREIRAKLEPFTVVLLAAALIRAGEPPIERRTIAFDFGRTKALSGIDVPERRQLEILESLGFELDGSNVTVPTWRRDIAVEDEVGELR